jgi:hypothetical protein
MSPLVAILACALLFVVLGVLTRDRRPDLELAGDEDACGDCRHPCILESNDDPA